MRAVDERKIWSNLRKSSSALVPLDLEHEIDRDSTLKLDERALVLAGFNGAGKSKALDALAGSLEARAVHIRLHELCEQIRVVLASRDDVDQMEAEVGPMSVDTELFASIQRVIGRDYQTIEWFGLELQSTTDGFRGWQVSDDEFRVPHFRVTADGYTYSSLEMGLGEFSIHVLFWILWQYREIPGLVVLLDEPDAYLPPRTKLRCFALILDFALKYEWQIVTSTHSQDLISAAREHGALRGLTRIGGVSTVADREYGLQLVRELIGNESADLILFCEDEQAAALIRSLLRSHGRQSVEKTVVIWKNGDGYLKSLAKHLPRTDVSPIKYSLVLDGDMRGTWDASKNPSGWPVLYLPTDKSPEHLMSFGKADLTGLSAGLAVNAVALALMLDGIEGADPHDWITELCERTGRRTETLDALADVWVSRNPELAAQFAAELDEATRS